MNLGLQNKTENKKYMKKKKKGHILINLFIAIVLVCMCGRGGNLFLIKNYIDIYCLLIQHLINFYYVYIKILNFKFITYSKFN